MSRGVLGEQIWLTRSDDPALAHHLSVVRTLTIAGFGGAVLLVSGLVLLNLPLAVAGLAISMLSKLWILDRMVWVYHDAAGERPGSTTE